MQCIQCPTGGGEREGNERKKYIKVICTNRFSMTPAFKGRTFFYQFIITCVQTS